MRLPNLRLKRLDLSRYEGRIFFCGDVHGHLAGLTECLTRQGFDPRTDRVFATGDLIDRGPDSQGCLRLLEQPWFDSVMGNHEQMLIQYMTGEIDAIEWGLNGGDWAAKLPRSELEALQSLIVSTMPLAFEIKTPRGRIG
ncbi:MAG: metallophosphoesterase, partial [Marinospirillum sp.]|uniref:metallophosphoesterase n=1 Tax=Marinospirillum sp. TaxID=2183934 RepID=UPI0019EFD669